MIPPGMSGNGFMSFHQCMRLTSSRHHFRITDDGKASTLLKDRPSIPGYPEKGSYIMRLGEFIGSGHDRRARIMTKLHQLASLQDFTPP